ncbi:hypothetical protein QR680_018167 [Steinernema hermaphroditum]|uniref:7TM GPCR serpentine receptor class x (Srx) domain-containing protein n=1 Tax=Steinernema hermaphroditum TaxID=289476 RepID=A0AA39HHU9_9BILA|nr:hypothetical protein QR680_018167 [Steinernema hermaphroditum]
MCATNVLIGCLYASISALCLPLYMVIIYIFLSTQSYRKLASYQLMTHLGAVDCLQLVVHFYSGIAAICGTNFGDVLEDILGGLANAAWIAMIMMVLTLAVNRLEVVGGVKFVPFLSPTKLYNLLACLCWAFGGVFFNFYALSKAGMKYSMENFYWSLEGDETLVDTLSNAETFSTIPALVVTFFIYVLIAGVILVKKKSFVKDKKVVSSHEVRLVVQAFVIFVYTSVVICCWHWGDRFLPHSFWTPIVINTLWILENGALTPALYLVMNVAIRRRFIAIVLCRKESHLFSRSKSTKVGVVTASANPSRTHI